MEDKPQKKTFIYDPGKDAYVRIGSPEVMLRQSDYSKAKGSPCLEYHSAGRVFRFPYSCYEPGEQKSLGHDEYVFLQSLTWEGKLPLSQDDRHIIRQHMDEAVASGVRLRWFDDNGMSPRGVKVLFSSPNYIHYHNVSFFLPDAYDYRAGSDHVCQVFNGFRPYHSLIGYDSQFGESKLTIYLFALPLLDAFQDEHVCLKDITYQRELTVDEKLVIAADIAAAVKVRGLGSIEWATTVPVRALV